MERWFVDTSAWFAFADRASRGHAAVAALLARPRARLVTSSYVFDETVTLARYRATHAAAVTIGRVLRDPNAVDRIRVTPEDEDAAWRLLEDRRDQRYSFTDCTSFVLMRRLRLRTAVALDEHFTREGFVTLPEPGG